MAERVNDTRIILAFFCRVIDINELISSSCPGAPPRTVRAKPPGCKTIFIGGIPENSTEEILHEVFESCGPILSIRMSKKNFAHIRFEIMESVDRALYISGKVIALLV